MPVPDCVNRYRRDLETELRAAVGDQPSPLHHMMRYHLGWVDDTGQDLPSSGKLSRPTLCLLACEAVGGHWPSALPAAAAIELLHNFSLIHDDIQDGSPERRDRPTVWKLWGEAQAINAGDAMYATAQLAMLRLCHEGVSATAAIELCRRLNQASLELCQGQYLDLEYERRIDVDVQEYLQMIGKKTACLFDTAFSLGAMLGNGSDSQVASLTSFGRSLGMAFQMHNDLLGIWTEGKGDKAVPSTDIAKKKKTLPVIYALQQADTTRRETMTRIYSSPSVSPEAARQVVNVLDSAGARRYTEDMRSRFHKESLGHLAEAGIPAPFERELGDMAAYLLGGD